MAYSARILQDSLNPVGDRLTTWELSYPRFVHAELMTHRMFSRNSASSRAIPIEKLIQRVIDDPVLPVWWGKNQPGMQAVGELQGLSLRQAKCHWLIARDQAVLRAQTLKRWGVHKQIVNRLLEPWTWIAVIVSATEYENWFHLRAHKDAQPEIRHLAEMMLPLYRETQPQALKAGEWHLPLSGFSGDEGLTLEEKIKVSVGRCARVSYLTHLGERDVQADLDLHDRLKGSGHWSPFEHVARALDSHQRSGNFTGFFQYRKSFTAENFLRIPEEADPLGG
jgi:hypothetical protein